MSKVVISVFDVFNSFAKVFICFFGSHLFAIIHKSFAQISFQIVLGYQAGIYDTFDYCFIESLFLQFFHQP